MIAAGMVPLATAASDAVTKPAATHARLEKATFAGGCFWCMEAPFDKLPGVVSVTSGYTGGSVKNPTYEQVSAGGTGHAEAVQIVYDPAKIGYESCSTSSGTTSTRQRPTGSSAIAGTSTGAPFSTITKSNTAWRNGPGRRWKNRNHSRRRS